MQLVQITTRKPTTPTTPGHDRFRHLAVELIRTENGFYAFDAHNVEFVQLDEIAYEVLSCLRQTRLTLLELANLLPHRSEAELREALDEIQAAQKQGYLVPTRFKRLVRDVGDTQKKAVTKEMKGLTVFITTDCNLACSYCLFGGQYERHPELSRKPMSWPTLRNAMEFLASNSADQKELRVDFFGGEPMLEFDMLVRALDHLQAIRPDSKVIGTIASNGTILTEAMLEELVGHGIYFQISIDGEKELHDRARRYRANNRGTFDVVMRNLRRIRERDPEYFRTRVRLKGVLTTENITTESEEFFANPLIHELVELGSMSFLAEEPHYDVARDSDHFAWLERLADRMRNMQGVSTLADIEAQLSSKERQLFHRSFADFFDIQAINKMYLAEMTEVPFRKGCTMGYAEGAVLPDGDIVVCHKSAGRRFAIGNVNEGRWYFDRMRVLKGLLREHGRRCECCFAQRFCSLCYEKMNGEGDDLSSSLHKYCEFTRRHFRVVFECMLEVLEQNPDLWREPERIIEAAVARKQAEETVEPTRAGAQA